MDSQQGQEITVPEMADQPVDPDRIVKHIMVIGFHHKHGYQVDYCYPPISPEQPVMSTPNKQIRLPDCWKTLPLLCLPDGSHNYDNDTIYFTMPDNSISDTASKDSPADNSSVQQGNKHSEISEQEAPIQTDQLGLRTIFGTACFRQIQADKLINRTDDITRVAVQKSVCILSTKPLFGLIRSKLEMITHAYFEELDFSKVQILRLTYENLNSLLSRDSVKENATFLGLSARHLISQFGCNVLVLFKAMLLEKKILFYKSPVRDLCSTIMSMCSLFTGLLESGGLDYSTCDLQLDATLLEALKLAPKVSDLADGPRGEEQQEDKVYFSPSREKVMIISPEKTSPTKNSSDKTNTNDQLDNSFNPNQTKSIELLSVTVDEDKNNQDESHRISSEYEVITNPEACSDDRHDEEGDDGVLADGCLVDDPFSLKLCRQKPEDCGLPLQIFTRGSFCLPYLSISYLDVLADERVRSYVIGATNFLFKQRKELYDLVVDMEDGQTINITINDPQLRKCLTLTTEDLRFMDYLTKNVKFDSSQEPRDEFDLMSHETTKWTGGDEWIRYHFRLYTLYLLKAASTTVTSSTAPNKSPNQAGGQQISTADSFNSNFIQSWKHTTNNYSIWERQNKVSMLDGLQARHPFSSPHGGKGLNLNDVRLKLSYAVNSSEKGRMISQTLHGIGKWSIWNNIASTSSSLISSVQASHSPDAKMSSTQQQSRGTGPE